MGSTHRLLGVALTLITAACGGGADNITGPPTPPPPAPMAGKVLVRVNTVGAVRDPDGYAVLLDGGQVGTITPQGVLVLSAVSTGRHTVGLAGIAPSCDPHAGGPSELEVRGGDSTVVSFTVPCAGLATIRLLTHTTGTELDPDGYVVTVAGVGDRPIGIEDSIEVSDVPAGPRQVILGEVAANCFPGPLPRPIDLPPGRTTVVAFVVSCLAPARGSIVVSVHTTAILAPSDLTFAVELDGGHRLPISSRGTATYPDVEAGSHSIRLALPGYCGVGLFGSSGSNPVTITLRPGERRTVAFDVLCLG